VIWSSISSEQAPKASETIKTTHKEHGLEGSFKIVEVINQESTERQFVKLELLQNLFGFPIRALNSPLSRNFFVFRYLELLDIVYYREN